MLAEFGLMRVARYWIQRWLCGRGGILAPLTLKKLFSPRGPNHGTTSSSPSDAAVRIWISTPV